MPIYLSILYNALVGSWDLAVPSIERAVKFTANKFAINRESASRIDGDTKITKVDRPVRCYNLAEH